MAEITPPQINYLSETGPVWLISREQRINIEPEITDFPSLGDPEKVLATFQFGSYEHAGRDITLMFRYGKDDKPPLVYYRRYTNDFFVDWRGQRGKIDTITIDQRRKRGDRLRVDFGPKPLSEIGELEIDGAIDVSIAAKKIGKLTARDSRNRRTGAHRTENEIIRVKIKDNEIIDEVDLGHNGSLETDGVVVRLRSERITDVKARDVLSYSATDERALTIKKLASKERTLRRLFRRYEGPMMMLVNPEDETRGNWVEYRLGTESLGPYMTLRFHFADEAGEMSTAESLRDLGLKVSYNRLTRRVIVEPDKGAQVKFDKVDIASWFLGHRGEVVFRGFSKLPEIKVRYLLSRKGVEIFAPGAIVASAKLIEGCVFEAKGVEGVLEMRGTPGKSSRAKIGEGGISMLSVNPGVPNVTVSTTGKVGVFDGGASATHVTADKVADKSFMNQESVPTIVETGKK